MSDVVGPADASGTVVSVTLVSATVVSVTVESSTVASVTVASVTVASVTVASVTVASVTIASVTVTSTAVVSASDVYMVVAATVGGPPANVVVIMTAKSIKKYMKRNMMNKKNETSVEENSW